MRRFALFLALLLVVGAAHRLTDAPSTRWLHGAIVVVAYFAAVSFVRGRVSAGSRRDEIRARLAEIDAAVEELGDGALRERLRAARAKIEPAFQHTSRVFFWTGSGETAAWRMIDDIEKRLAETWEPSRFAARLPALRARVGAFPEAAGALPEPGTDDKEEYLALLAIEREVLHAKDIQIDYHNNKLTWLMGAALVAIALIFVADEHAGLLLLAGAVGGLLGRLTRVVRAPKAPHEYELRWLSLYLSPLVGALLGWGGQALFGLVQAFHVLPGVHVPTVGLALLCGFSERFFQSLADRAEAAVDKTPKG